MRGSSSPSGRAPGLALALALAFGCGACGDAATPAPAPARATTAGKFRSPATTRAATLWAVGDGADGSTAARRVFARIEAGRPLRMLYLGDVYPAGSAAAFRGHYDAVYRRLRRRTLPTPGNHEWAARRSGYDPYWSAIVHGRPPSFYATSIAGWQVLSLNSEEALGPRSRQGRWLAGQVRGPGTCRLAFWHRPRFSAGLHGDQQDVDPLWQAVRGRAALVLNGHDHDMQQFRPMSGTTVLIAGAGGHGRYPVNPLDRRLAWSDAGSYGALRLRLRPGTAAFEFVSDSGRILRRGSTTCRQLRQTVSRR